MMLTGRARAIGVLARGWWAPRATVSRLQFRVLPTDVDLNVHLTNSRYPQLMDMGRLDLLLRAGWHRLPRSERPWPVAVEITQRFRLELRLGQRFTLETRATGRVRRALVFEQRFLVGDVVHAEAEVRVVVLRGGRVVDPGALVALLGVGETG
jgi:acyl-CoA thioesterase FadM